MSGLNSLANVALRPWPAPKKEALSRQDMLDQTVQLVNERSQHLREITEQKLEDEIAAGTNGLEDAHDESDQDESDKALSTKEKLEEINRVRHDVVGKLDWASFAAGNALNLVSLILTRDAQKGIPEHAFTPMFRHQNVPSGSLELAKGSPEDDTYKAEVRERAAADEKRRVLVMKGSRMDALDWATDSLLKAATELEGEIRKETKYWDEILSISEKSWSLQRTRKGARNAQFAVRYGPPEASHAFRSRGVAPLRMDKDGSIVLDPALALKPKTVRVRVTEDGKTTGTSRINIPDRLSELQFEQSIQLARETIFEEELFHEMSMESRQLIAYNVELRNSVLHVMLPGQDNQPLHRKLLIDYVPRDDSASFSNAGVHDWLAQNIADGLRSLLAHEYRMRLYRRSRIPPPMSQHRLQEPTPPLLRTVLSIISHLDAVESLQVHLGALAKTLKSAGLDVNVEASCETSWEKMCDLVEGAPSDGVPAAAQLLNLFIRPLHGTASISLPSANGSPPETLSIVTRTYIGPPHFGTEHEVSLPPALYTLFNEQDQQSPLKFSSTQEVRSYLGWIISIDVSQILLLREFPGRASIRSSDPQICILCKGSKKGLVKEGELEIELEEAELRATATISVGQLATGVERETFVWNGTFGQPPLKETVKRWFG